MLIVIADRLKIYLRHKDTVARLEHLIALFDDIRGVRELCAQRITQGGGKIY